MSVLPPKPLHAQMLREAREFPSPEARKKYLEDHPNADPSKHTVKGEGGPGGSKEDKPKGKGKSKQDQGGGTKVKVDEEKLKARRPKIESEDLSGYPPNAKADDLDPDHREEIADYKLEVVGNDARQAVEIARKIKEGIKKGSDICKLNPPVCEGNMGLTRDKMPQIEGEKSVKEMIRTEDDHIKNDKFKHPTEKGEDGKPKKVSFDELPEKEQGKIKKDWELERKKGNAMVQAGADPNDDRNILQQMIGHLSKNGVKTSETKIPVGALKATQSEIKAEKTYGMADAHLKGKFPGIDDSVVVSKDGHILDGHHRWAALLTIDPGREMKVKVIDMDMKDLLSEAQAVPGVYKADFEGNPLPEEDQKSYKTEAKSKFKSKGKKPKKKGSLRTAAIQMAYANPALRPHILALLK